MKIGWICIAIMTLEMSIYVAAVDGDVVTILGMVGASFAMLLEGIGIRWDRIMR